ncbi:hypothetical protein JM93_01070 [Roseibium hamelinense]|uniref:Tat pathway signal sequence domain protein n=1 Tax=Roseibium hamelinense TaxID=150831 RepID=A0A562T9X9_9HYPH|nr:hypothetical protein [Roseibium hamelinense]MTI45532.1 hypothetical protein [Roseibium hamelinense]TWI90093.1 hypothetical protein JM93_01070 [Roseibium hamelinense]
MSHFFEKMFSISILAALTFLASAGLPGHPVAAESNGLSIELNKIEQTSKGCRLSFLAVNGTGTDLPKSPYELVFFDREGVIESLTAFDFGALSAGKTVVRQFQVPGLECAGTGRILVNGPSGCTGETKPAHCSAVLKLSSRATVPLVQ